MPIRSIKAKKYKGVSELYRNSDGKITGYYVSFRDENGKPVKQRVTAENRDDALLALNRIKFDIQRVKEYSSETATRKKLKRVTLQEAFDIWIDTVSNASIKQYTSIYNKHIKIYIGKKLLDDISNSDGETIVARLKKQDYSTQTQNGVIAVIKIIINWAIRNDLATKNGLAYLKRQKLSNARMRLLTKKEIMQLSKDASDPKLALFIKMLFYTAQRPASLLRLKKKDIINGEIHISPIKGQDWNVIPIHSEFNEEFSKWIDPLELDQYLFYKSETNKHTPMSYRNIAFLAKKLFVPLNVGLEWKSDRAMIASLYTIRHSAATIILSQTGNQRLVQAILNHAGPEMTARYAKLLDGAKKTGIEAL